MKTSRKPAITAVAGALALGMFAPATAASASVPGIEGYSDVVANEAITTLSSERGVSEVAAATLLQTQQNSVDALDELRSSLSSDIVSEYLDASGKPVVNVATKAAAAKAEAAGATAKVVSRTAEQLDAARAQLESVSVAHTSVGLDPQNNQLVVTIADQAKDSAAAKLTQKAAQLGDAVRVEH